MLHVAVYLLLNSVWYTCIFPQNMFHINMFTISNVDIICFKISKHVSVPVLKFILFYQAGIIITHKPKPYDFVVYSHTVFNKLKKGYLH